MEVIVSPFEHSAEKPGGHGRPSGRFAAFGCGPHGYRHRHGHGGPHGMGHFGPFGRAKRGNVRAAVLAVLAEQPMHGYEIMQQLEERSGGMWRPSPGSVYPTLQLLEDQGLIKGEDVEGKRIFSLTDAGRTEAEASAERLGTPPWTASGHGPEGPRHKLRQAVFQLGAAVKQVGMSGSDEQIAETLAILAEARKRIYGMLAEAE
jgi:DNA-binding PadR family transcriptional regulator